MPWKSYVPTVPLAVAAGFVVWSFRAPIAFWLFGEAVLSVYKLPLFDMFGLPALLIIGFIAGCASPKGFWLWGLATNLLQPPAEVALPVHQVSRGEFMPSDLPGLIFVTIAIFTVNTAACTVVSALGASLRLLWWRLRGEQIA